VTPPETKQPQSGIARFLPIVGWLPNYHRAWSRPDLIAGATVAALVIPKSLGYASIAGVPIQHGLYAAAAERAHDALSGKYGWQWRLAGNRIETYLEISPNVG
jgi:hypothetical protein